MHVIAAHHVYLSKVKTSFLDSVLVSLNGANWTIRLTQLSGHRSDRFDVIVGRQGNDCPGFSGGDLEICNLGLAPVVLNGQRVVHLNGTFQDKLIHLHSGPSELLSPHGVSPPNWKMRSQLRDQTGHN